MKSVNQLFKMEISSEETIHNEQFILQDLFPLAIFFPRDCCVKDFLSHVYKHDLKLPTYDYLRTLHL